MTVKTRQEEEAPESSWSSWWDGSESYEDETKERQGGFFRRSRSQPRSSRRDTRNDSDGNSSTLGRATRRGRSESRERIRRSKRPLLRSGRKKTTTTTKVSTADASLLSRKADSRQKKVVYNAFSENPYKVLTVEANDNSMRLKYEDHVILKILASTVTLSDCLIRRGISFGPSPKLPATPGMDVIGVIVQRGDRVKDFNVGDRVAALVRTGGNARYIDVAASDLVPVPSACDSTEAACMVSTYMTAYQCVRLATQNTFEMKNKRVLITAGTEPTGQALIQLCRRAGAGEIFVCGPNNRSRFIRTVLRAKPMSDDPKQWNEKVKGSMDVVFDGACYDGLHSASEGVNSDGVLISVGMSSLLSKETPGVLGAPMSAYWERLKSNVMTHSTSYEVWDSFREDKGGYKLDLEILFYLLRKRFIKPLILKRVSLSEVVDAHHLIEHKDAHGEIICLPWRRI